MALAGAGGVPGSALLSLHWPCQLDQPPSGGNADANTDTAIATHTRTADANPTYSYTHHVLNFLQYRNGDTTGRV